MSMQKEIEKFMNSAGVSLDYKIVNLGGRSLYIEGIKSVVSFGVQNLDFQLKKQVLSVKGENLKISYLDKTTCVVHGEIAWVGIV